MLIGHGRAENVTEPERIDGNGVADDGDWCGHLSHQSETLHVPAAATDALQLKSMTVNRLLRNTGNPGIGGHSATRSRYVPSRCQGARANAVRPLK